MLAMTIKQQLKGMALYFTAAFIVLTLAVFLGDIQSNSDIITFFMMIAVLAWPVISASLIFNREFRDGALVYLLGSPHARMQIILKKIIPAMALAMVPMIIFQLVVLFTIQGRGQISALSFALLFLTVWSSAFLFSFSPSIISLFSLTMLTSTVMFALIPFIFTLISSWRDDSTSHGYRLLAMMGFYGGEQLALWLLPLLPTVFLCIWFWGFHTFGEPDFRRTYRRMAPRAGVSTLSAIVVIFVLSYLFMPVFPDGFYHLTREGHLFRHGNLSSDLKTDKQTFTLKHANKSRFLAETESELILSMAEEQDQIKLVGWNKTDGNTRTIARFPGRPYQNLIFQPPHAVLCLPAREPKAWTEIDTLSGKATTHPMAPFEQDGKKRNMVPIAQLSHDGHQILLATNNLSTWSFYSDPLNLYLCQQKESPRYMGQYQSLPIQLSEQELVLISKPTKTIEKYRFENESLTLTQSVSYPQTGYWRIRQDDRYWPENQPVFGSFGQTKDKHLMKLGLNPLSLTFTDLEIMGTDVYSHIISTPYWSAMVQTHKETDAVTVQRLDQDRPPVTFSLKDGHQYWEEQIYGFIILQGWLPKERFNMMEQKLETMPNW